MRTAQRSGFVLFVISCLFCAQAFAETIVMSTEVTSMSLTGAAVMPLGQGWSNISTSITLTRSPNSQSTGQITATGQTQSGQYEVESFFDVFFDLSITDTDAGSDFPGMPDGSSLNYPNNGPARLTNSYVATFDPNLPVNGLFPPPEIDPYIGFFSLGIPLEQDLDGNGQLDQIKFSQGSFTVLENSRTFITLPDGTVIFGFGGSLTLEGGVSDLCSDPPFSITLTGPTTATSRIESSPAIPEPASVFLLGTGLGVLALAASRRKKV